MVSTSATARLWDVIVAGAGPGGSACAALLAQGGLSVLVIEKAEFPRFQIGESLLPGCMPVLARLGIDATDDAFVYKRGAEFVCEDSGRSQCFAFSEALEGCAEHAWHVDRSLFDMRLRDRARELGATVRHGEAVTDVALAAEAVDVTSRSVEPGAGRAETVRVDRARYFIDATGQNRLLARRSQSVRHDERFGKAAVYAHFDGVGDAYDEVFQGVNDIRIMLREDGWGWIIPLPERRVSIGLVSRERVGQTELDAGLLAGPLAAKLTAGARRGETRIVGNYSYENTSPFGARYATVGDARSFIDPVFSSGVTLALRGADGLADAVLGGFARGEEAQPHLTRDHATSMRRAYDTFGALVGRFYHGSFAESFFLRRMPDYELRRGVMSVLAGDVWRSDNPFQEMLLRGRGRGPRAETKSAGAKRLPGRAVG